MLSHPGSGTSSNLQRSKSTLSVKERRKQPLQAERIDPQTARAHALIAAHRAVNKSQARPPIELVRTESLISNKSITSHQEQSIKFSPASHLKRQRSTLQTRVPRLADTLRVPGTQDQTGTSNKTVSDKIEWEIPGENYGAEPSSYRKLKRSRSLLTPVRQVNRPSSQTPETALSQSSTLRQTGSPVALSSPGLKVRLKRSLNFLRQNQSIPNRVITAPAQLQSQKPCHPEALALARTQYLEELGQQRLVKKPSISLSTTKRRARKAFRKSVRTSEGAANEAFMVEPERRSLEKVVTKSVSAFLSDRLKKMFTRSKRNDTLPPQQLKASRLHLNLDLNTPSPEAGFDSYLEDEPQVARRNSLCFPSNFEADSDDDLERLSQELSQSGSHESLCSNSKSRVTSWTNSTVTSSVAGQTLPCEPKRLSIIKEDGGPHQPSSSVGRHVGGVFHKPISLPRHNFEDVPALQQPLNIPPGQQIDSQRIYSALIKRLDDEQKEMERTEVAFREINIARDQDEVVSHYLCPTSTIRRVKSRASTSLTDIQEDDSQQHRNVSLQYSNPTTPDPEQQQIYVKKRQTAPIHPKFQSCNNAPSERGRNISTSTSTNPFCNSFETSITQCDDQVSNGSDYETGSLVRKHGVVTSSFGNGDLAQSTESVYSRTTNGGKNFDYVAPAESTEKLKTEGTISNRPDDLLPSQHYRSRLAECPPSGDDPGFNGSNSRKGPWKEWMKYQTANLETGKLHRRTLAHFREHAQIDPGDTDVGCNQNRLLQQSFDVKLAPKQLSRPYNKSQYLSQVSESNSPSGISTSSKSDLWLRQVPQKCTPMLHTNALVRKSQSALLSQTGSKLQPVTDDKKASNLQKITPDNVANILKERRSQVTLSKQQSPGKENDPIATSNSPPVSTPGRHSLSAYDNGNNGRLCKGKSTIGFGYVDDRVRKGDHSTTLPDSPSDKLRNMLSARLSKPFDVDIPDCNRSFDSTYLGQRESGSGNRLSVATTSSATRRPKTYGNLGPVPFTGDTSCKPRTYGDLGPVPPVSNEPYGDTRSEESEPTALPPLTTTSNAQRSVSGLSLSLASKRVISSLLRNKKKQEDNARGVSPAGSSAFI